MDGFTWTKPAASLNIPVVPGDDGWCVRDAICELLAWPRDSKNWRAFVEAPQSSDFHRLIDYLGLSWFDLYGPQLVNNLVHPGILLYFLECPGMPSDLLMAHTVFETDLRRIVGIPDNYAPYNPELVAVIVDIQQPPRERGRTEASWLEDLTRDTIREVREHW
jgi:hypothetical protein